MNQEKIEKLQAAGFEPVSVEELIGGIYLVTAHYSRIRAGWSEYYIVSASSREEAETKVLAATNCTRVEVELLENLEEPHLICEL